MNRKPGGRRRYRARHQTFPPMAEVIALSFVRRQLLIAAVITLVLNGVLTWLIFRGRDTLELWGVGNVVFDLAVSTLMPIFATTLAVTYGTRKGLAVGRLLPYSAALPLTLPRRPPVRALLLSIGSMVIFGTLGTIALVAFWSPEATLFDLLIFKSIYGVVLLVAVVPIIVLGAFDQAPTAQEPDRARRHLKAIP